MSILKIKMETKSMDEFKYGNQEQWKRSKFLIFSIGIFLCITTTFTMLVVLNIFVLTYQTRTISCQEIPNHQKQPYPISTFSTDASDTQDPDTVTTPSSDYSEELTTHFVPTTLVSTKTSITTHRSSYSTPTQTVKPLRNPVVILNDIIGNLVSYNCVKRCNSSSVITASLNLSLSAVGNNYIILTLPVNSSKVGVAKSKVAYHALDLLYKDRVNESFVRDEWYFPVLPEEPNCPINETEITLENCKERNDYTNMRAK